MNMKIAIVSPYPMDPSKTTGGIQAVVQNLVKGLKNRVELHVVTIDYDQETHVINEPGVNLHYISSGKGTNRLILYYPERKWIRKTLDEISPDLVHVHGTDMFGYSALNLPYPTLLTVHGILSEEAKIKNPNLSFWTNRFNRIKGSFNTFFENRTLKNINDVIVISPYVEKMIEDRSSATFYHIDNPIDDSFFDMADKAIKGRILFVGMIRSRKGVLNLVEAIHLAGKNHPDLHLNVVGKVFEPQYYQLINNFIREKKLQNKVAFIGRVSDEELCQEFEQCSALVLPSVEESSPMVVEQAMAAGKPVIASRVGGIPFMIEDKRSGIMVEFGDIQGLAKALSYLNENEKDAKNMGIRGREIALKRFKQSAIINKTFDVYKKIIEDGKN